VKNQKWLLHFIYPNARADIKANPQGADFINLPKISIMLKTLETFLGYFQNSMYIFDMNSQNAFIQNLNWGIAEIWTT